ncbi:dihydrofolate reductase family protein [Rhizobium sp. NTR19]|uniref:Dihydrofolate reductase family protein n=1 Tax=Neorhizobium turbinariae TaxID=2937795 RepID=A0ABT0IUZ0_9HYPH|nr:dihydrofolate reductase family protein [Neorhizobium turbinariae]MCK8781681.1 dihydrofolate reductase family protein [Neorhizobium turbinariae]
MAKLVFALNQSLDGYIDHMRMGPPDAALFRHYIDDVRSLSGLIYGRRMYETMRYWDDEHAEWDGPRREYAQAWRAQPKWVVSRTLQAVGPNAMLISDDLEAAVRSLKADRDGEMEVAGPELAQALGELGLVDEYGIYIHPEVLGSGQPLFAGPRPRLRLVDSQRIGGDVVRLTYTPA